MVYECAMKMMIPRVKNDTLVRYLESGRAIELFYDVIDDIPACLQVRPTDVRCSSVRRLADLILQTEKVN